MRFSSIEGHVPLIRPVSNQFQISGEKLSCRLPRRGMGYLLDETMWSPLQRGRKGLPEVVHVDEELDKAQDTVLENSNLHWRGRGGEEGR